MSPSGEHLALSDPLDSPTAPRESAVLARAEPGRCHTDALIEKESGSDGSNPNRSLFLLGRSRSVANQGRCRADCSGWREVPP